MLKGKDIISVSDLSKKEIEVIHERAREFKSDIFQKPILKGKTLAMIFQKASTRTRVSFETAMHQLGGYAIYLDWFDIQLGRGETIHDTGKVLSRYVDAIMIRTFEQKTVEELAKASDIPVINGLTDLEHPCQILADLFTIREKKRKFKGLKLAYFGDGNNVCNSLLLGCAIMGLNMVASCPDGYLPNKEIMERAIEISKKNNSSIRIISDPLEAAKDADIIYTDAWISMGQEKERDKRIHIFKRYQVNKRLLDVAKKDVIVMHCLPAHREEEITSDILDGEHSVVWDQAENRLHVQKAILSLIM